MVTVEILFDRESCTYRVGEEGSFEVRILKDENEELTLLKMTKPPCIEVLNFESLGNKIFLGGFHVERGAIYGAFTVKFRAVKPWEKYLWNIIIETKEKGQLISGAKTIRVVENIASVDAISETRDLILEKLKHVKIDVAGRALRNLGMSITQLMKLKNL